ncbi:MAG TPA: gamma-glutamyl-gamma-aminobutyrate hydrolase family protein [Stellaceae bacterium]|nr:gamma-glutamyl-gamma-aminobutyrate hydrolase family protein [Stellaceae bacterium]
MIVYIGFAQRDEWTGWAQTYARHAQRFEAASGGAPCLVVPFYHVCPDLLARLAPSAVVMSGFARSFQDYDVQSFYPVADLLEHAVDTPILALCGSHQLTGFLFNGTLRTAGRLEDEPMRRRRAGEPIVNPDYHPDFFMERGFYELDLHVDDPLFAGCGRPPVVYESHYCETKTLPPGFRLLASTPDCRIQAMRHETRPLVGLQFHPEDYSDRFPDGRRILENFFTRYRS